MAVLFIFGSDRKSEVEQIWAMDGTVESGFSSDGSIEECVRLRRRRASVQLSLENIHRATDRSLSSPPWKSRKCSAFSSLKHMLWADFSF